MARDGVLIERGEPNVAVVVMRGEHDAFGAPNLEKQLMSLLDEDLSIVIDLTQATFLDSMTLFLLLRARTRASERGLGFSLQLGPGAGKHVHRAFELTKLTEVFSVAPTREGALLAARVPVTPD